MKRKIYLLFISALFCIYTANGQVDLQLKDISFSSNQVTEGESVTTTFKVINTGSEGTVASNVAVYISSDATLTTSTDNQLENWTLNALESGSISTYYDYSISIPDGYGGSVYHLFLVVDEDQLIAEINENNNSSNQEIHIKEKNVLSNDLTIRNPSLSKAVAYRSETITFDAEIHNLGTDPVNNVTFRVIISESNSSTGGSSETLYSETGSLVGNDSYTFTSESIQIPSYWTTGSAYIHFVADQNNTVQETNESNNSSYTSIQIKETPKPELSIQSFNLSANIVVHDENLSTTAKIINSSETDAGGFYISYYLDSDNNLSNGTTYLLGDYYVSSLDQQESMNINQNLQIPSGSLGIYYIHAVIDSESDITESNEHNNQFTATTPIRIDPKDIDLIIENQTINGTTFKAGQTVNFEARVRNIGSQSIDYSYLGYYISEDASWDSSDDYISQDYVSSLSANGYNDESYNYTINDNYLGDYYILFVADRYNSRIENDESNNVKAVPITIQPAFFDFQITSADDFASEWALESYNQIDLEIVNNGIDDLDASLNITFYASLDNVFGNDVYVGQYSYNSGIDGGETISLDDMDVYTYPYMEVGAEYTLFAKIDNYNDYNETDETNNTFQIGTISAKEAEIDLTLSNVSLSQVDRIELDATNYIYYDYENIEPDGAEYTYTGFYLSEDETLNTSEDTRISTEYESAIAGNESVSASESIYLSRNNYSTGTYYLFLVADYDDRRDETNEANNVYSFGQVELYVPDFDLEITAASTTNSDWLKGTSNSISYDITNNGINDQVAYTYTQFYLSTDNVLNDGDLSLGTDYVSEMDPQETFNLNHNVSVSEDLADGTYYILLEADTYDYRLEVNEDNNVFNMGQVTISTPDYDLEITTATIASPELVIGGSNVLVEYTLINNATVNELGSSSTGFYLSVDNTLNTSEDTYITSNTSGSLAPGASIDESRNVSVGTNIATGSYYLFLLADRNNSYSETNEDNNTYSLGEVTVRNPDFDLEITAASATSTDWLKGSSNAISYDITNNGTNDQIQYTYTRFYLSTDNVLDDGDLSLGTDYVSEMDPQETFNLNHNVSVSEDLADGTYYILLEADTYDYRSEANEDNNVFNMGQVTISTPDFDLEITAASATSTDWLKGSSNATSYDITNNGTNDQIQYTYTRFYLSPDNVLDDGDLALGTDYVSAMDPQETFNLNHNVSVPADVADGTYYIFFEADTYDYRSETNEDNNVFNMGQVTISTPDFDLEITNPSITNTTWKRGGLSNSIAYDITNNGIDDDIPSYSYTGVYLSEDLVLDESDVLVDTDYNPALVTGATSNETASIEISNSEISTGTYYVLLEADTYEYFEETNESNNVISAGQITLVDSDFDLEMTASNIANTAWEKETSESIEYTLSNNGTEDDIPYSYTRIFLSTDQVIDNNDYNLTSDHSATVSAGGTLTDTYNFTVPSDIDDGTYYVLFEVDIYGYWDETDETNNQYVGSQVTISTGSGARTAGASTLNNSNNLFVYPNPSDDFIKVQNQDELIGKAFSLFDQTGKLALSGVFTERQVDVSNLRTGVYLMTIDSGQKTIKIRFIKK